MFVVEGKYRLHGKTQMSFALTLYTIGNFFWDANLQNCNTVAEDILNVATRAMDLCSTFHWRRCGPFYSPIRQFYTRYHYQYPCH